MMKLTCKKKKIKVHQGIIKELNDFFTCLPTLDDISNQCLDFIRGMRNASKIIITTDDEFYRESVEKHAKELYDENKADMDAGETSPHSVHSYIDENDINPLKMDLPQEFMEKYRILSHDEWNKKYRLENKIHDKVQEAKALRAIDEAITDDYKNFILNHVKTDIKIREKRKKLMEKYNEEIASHPFEEPKFEPNTDPTIMDIFDSALDVLIQKNKVDINHALSLRSKFQAYCAKHGETNDIFDTFMLMIENNDEKLSLSRDEFVASL